MTLVCHALPPYWLSHGVAMLEVDILHPLCVASLSSLTLFSCFSLFWLNLSRFRGCCLVYAWWDSRLASRTTATQEGVLLLGCGHCGAPGCRHILSLSSLPSFSAVISFFSCLSLLALSPSFYQVHLLGHPTPSAVELVNNWLSRTWCAAS